MAANIAARQQDIAAGWRGKFAGLFAPIVEPMRTTVGAC